MIACLCGMVTLTPLMPRALIASAALPMSSGWTSKAVYTQSSPRAEKALLCMSGERLWLTGWPNMP